ncbi:MAG TPA: hypothetical protein DCM05_05920 [Elusimicrobia bacterium]|nr:hypothetical protein [Elusimicrobiota bacterium]
MRIRSLLSLAVFSVGALGLLAMVVDRERATREFLYNRLETRAQVIEESIAAVALPHLIDQSPLDKTTIDLLSKLPDVDYILISDREGAPLYANVAKPERYRTESAADRLPLLHEISEDGTTYGTIRLGLSLRKLHRGLRDIFTRSLLMAGLAIALLALVSWYLGALLGRQLDEFVGHLENTASPLPEEPPRLFRRSELARVLAAFKKQRARLEEEASLREGVERQKNDLTNMVIHDLKQPLTVLKTVLSTIAEPGASNSSGLGHNKALRMADKAVLRLKAMIEDMLQIARLNNTEAPLQKTRIPAADFLKECAEESALVVRHFGRIFKADVPAEAGALFVYGDRNMLRRLIGNLVMNAIEYSPEGTPVTLGLRVRGEARRMEIFVHDDGPGISAKHLDLLFNRYATSGQASSNVGLGLAFCKLTAERHDSTLTVESGNGRGTTFTLSMPAAGQPGPASTESAEAS